MNTNTQPTSKNDLRDKFAMAALSGILATYSGLETGFPTASYVAETAYEYAEAMLEQRELILAAVEVD